MPDRRGPQPDACSLFPLPLNESQEVLLSRRSTQEMERRRDRRWRGALRHSRSVDGALASCKAAGQSPAVPRAARRGTCCFPPPRQGAGRPRRWHRGFQEGRKSPNRLGGRHSSAGVLCSSASRVAAPAALSVTASGACTVFVRRIAGAGPPGPSGRSLSQNGYG